MKIRIRRPRSCLGWFLWLLGILLSLVLLNNLYAWARIFAAQAAAYDLAGELGYTPDDYLRSGMYPTNVYIFTGSAVCKAEFVFVTPLDLPEFEARLLAARPGTWINRPCVLADRTNFYGRPPTQRERCEWRARCLEDVSPLPAMSWFLARETPATQTPNVEWLQTAQVPARITFGDQPIDGNIVVIHRSAGRYPIWVWC